MTPETIVVADDEPFIVRALCVVLERAGYTVRTAGDGAAALERVRAWQPAVVLVDAKMPHLDGYAVCAAVRGDPGILSQPHIIMLTGSSDATDRDRARAAGVDEFMSKPFSPLKILEHVRAAIGTARGSDGAVRPSADWAVPAVHHALPAGVRPG